MAHDLEAPPALAALLGGLDEIAVVVGPAAAPRLAVVREALTRAVARRDAGDPVGAAQAIAVAMQALAAMADALDPGEAAAMRAVAAHFGAALARGETAEMARASALMRERSGARERDPKT